METPSRLKKKQSWMGNLLRNVVVHSAMTAKAAVDSVREHISGSSMPKLPEDPPSSPKKTDRATMPSRLSSTHRRSLSAKSAIASIRNHLPRRSMDAKRHSFSDLLHRSESHTSRSASRHKSTKSQNDLLDLAARVALPSSPIDVPECAPSLALDLSPIRLFTSPPPATADAICDLFDSSSGPSLASSSFHDCRSGDPIDSAVLLAQPPVAEVRETLYEKLQPDNASALAILPSCRSPLPGTNLAMDFDEHDLNAIAVKEPDSAKLAKTLSSSQSLNALTSSPAPEDWKVHSHQELRVFAESSPTPAILPAADPSLHEKSSKYGGTPSPTRSVTLAIRTKQGQENTQLLNQTSPVSPLSSEVSSCRTSPLKSRNELDLTVTLLRERTNDVTPLLDRFAELYSATQPAAPSSDSSLEHYSKPCGLQGIDIAVTTPANTVEPAQTLSFPLQSETRAPPDTDRETSEASEDDSSAISHSIAHERAEALLSGSSTWLDSSSSLSYDDAASGLYPQSTISFANSNEERVEHSSLFEY